MSLLPLSLASKALGLKYSRLAGLTCVTPIHSQLLSLQQIPESFAQSRASSNPQV